MTLYYSTFYYSISSRFRWKFEVPWRFFALLFDFWWVKRSLGRNSKLKFEISLRLNYNFEIQFLKNYQNRQISKVFCHKTFQLKVFSKKSIFVSIRVQNNRVALIFFVPSSLIRYLPNAYQIRETSHYSMRSHIRWKSNSPWKSN